MVAKEDSSVAFNYVTKKLFRALQKYVTLVVKIRTDKPL